MAVQTLVLGARPIRRRDLLALSGAGALGMVGCAAGTSRGAPDSAPAPLAVGRVGLSFYGAAAAVVVPILERLGHRATISEGPHADIYRALGRGQVDLLVASWLPNAHGPLHAPLAAQLVEAAVLYEDARLYWAVPAHVPADLVRSVADLARPEVRAQMDPEIVGVGPGSGLMRGSEALLSAYGLDQAGYTLRVAPPDEWRGRFEEAVASGRWRVMPLWRPQYLNAKYGPRPLEEPRGIFQPDHAVLVFRRAVWAALPERSRRVIGRIRLGIPAVEGIEARMVVDGLSAEQAGAEWIEAHRAVVEAWFEPIA